MNSTDAPQTMVVDAAPVTVMSIPPLVVSAVMATSHDVAPALLMSVVGESTEPIMAVDAALASLLISTLRIYAAWSVPLVDLATTLMSANTAWLLSRMK